VSQQFRGRAGQAVTAALFAAGAYLGRDLPYGLGFVCFIAAFACLIGIFRLSHDSASGR
jgi:modulator of FtsH protease